MTILPTSRKNAKTIQSKFYFTGKPCKHGHISKRHMSDSSCVECTRVRGVEYRKNNSEKIKEYLENNKEKRIIAKAKHYQENKEKILAARAEYRRNNKEQIAIAKAEDRRNNSEKYTAISAKHYQENKERIAIVKTEYRQNNRDKINARSAKRRAAKLKRTPLWLSDADKEIIQNMYSMAAKISEETGIPHHVDHEIPLQGEFVSGLHVPLNLQILTASENTSKGNRVTLKVVK